MGCQIRGNKYYASNGNESILYKDLESNVGKAQAGDLFVLAYTPEFKKQVVTTELQKYRQNVPTLPQDLKFRETNEKGIRTFHLADGAKIGRIQLVKYKDGFKVKSVLVDEKYQGSGYGKALYIYAIRRLMSEGQSFYTDTLRTEAANRVWNSLDAMGLTSEDNRVVRPYPVDSFDQNGEIRADKVIQFAREQNEQTEPLTFVEQQQVRMMMSEFPNVRDSDQLLEKLQRAFYNEQGYFAPTNESLTKSRLYTKYEISRILQDVKVLGAIKETVEKLKRTETIENTSTVQNSIKTDEINSLGKIEVLNPYIVKQDIIQELGGTENPDLSEVRDTTITESFLGTFKRIPVINEVGESVNEEVIYTNAVKLVDKPEIFRAISAIENANPNVVTTNLQNKLAKWLLNFGIDIQGFTKDLLPSLRAMLQNPTQENVQQYSETYREVFDKPVQGREKVLQIEKQERDLVFLETNRSEQELFDDLSLLKTETPNVYHVIEKVEFQDLKDYLIKIKRVNTKRLERKVPIITKVQILNGSSVQKAKDAFESYSNIILPLSADYNELLRMFDIIDNGEVLDALPYNLIEEDYGVSEQDVRSLIKRYEKALDNLELLDSEVNIADISELQAYKEYFNYQVTPSIETKEFSPTILKNDVEYLTGEFIADFAIEKLKNPESGFYSKFEINEKGIELKYADPLSMAEIEAYLKDGVKLGEELVEYSLISKQMPNLTNIESENYGTSFERKLDAVNNFEKVKEAKGEFSKLNRDILVAKNETAEYLRNGEELYELQTKESNMSVYGRIEKNNNILFNDLAPQEVSPAVVKVALSIAKIKDYAEVKKKWNKNDLGDNFACE